MGKIGRNTSRARPWRLVLAGILDGKEGISILNLRKVVNIQHDVHDVPWEAPVVLERLGRWVVFQGPRNSFAEIVIVSMPEGLL